jgi:hypothetical protein
VVLDVEIFLLLVKVGEVTENVGEATEEAVSITIVVDGCFEKILLEIGLLFEISAVHVKFEVWVGIDIKEVCVNGSVTDRDGAIEFAVGTMAGNILSEDTPEDIGKVGVADEVVEIATV